MSSDNYHGTDIADYLTEAEGADPGAARFAARAIATAWNNREFWLSATACPLARCGLLTGEPWLDSHDKALVDRLQRHFHVHIHDVPAWEPNGHGGRWS